MTELYIFLMGVVVGFVLRRMWLAVRLTHMKQEPLDVGFPVDLDAAELDAIPVSRVVDDEEPSKWEKMQEARKQGGTISW